MISRHGYEATIHEAEAGTKPQYPYEDKAEAILLKTHEAEVEAEAILLKNP